MRLNYMLLLIVFTDAPRAWCFKILATNPEFTAVGDLYFHLSENT